MKEQHTTNTMEEELTKSTRKACSEAKCREERCREYESVRENKNGSDESVSMTDSGQGKIKRK